MHAASAATCHAKHASATRVARDHDCAHASNAGEAHACQLLLAAFPGRRLLTLAEVSHLLRPCPACPTYAWGGPPPDS
eukprot:13484249-Alexandrium_andersonii.AAC.1